MTGILWPDGRHLSPRDLDLLLAYVESHQGTDLIVTTTEQEHTP